MSVVASEAIFNSLRSLPWAAEVQVENTAGVLQLLPTSSSQVTALVEIAKRSLVGVFHHFGYKAPHRGTVDFLNALFGMERLTSLCKRAGVDLGKVVTRLEMQKIFVYAAEVQYCDLEELVHLSKNASSKLPSSDNMIELLSVLKEVSSVADCDAKTLQKMVDVLIPFRKKEDLFLGDVPACITVLDSGKTFCGVKERVSVYQSLRDPSCTKKSWIMQLAKQLTNLEVPKGVVIANSKGGFHVVHDVVHKGGAYKYFLKPVGIDPADPIHYVLYRGTREPIFATDGRETIIDDLRLDIGSAGPMATYDRTRELLTDPCNGFISSKEVKIVGISMSLGGAHLARDATLHHFDKVITVASPGIDKATCELFSKRAFKMSITHYIEGGDLVHHFGEVKLGYGCNPVDVKVKVHILIPGTTEELPPDAIAPFPKLPQAYAPFLFNALASFTYALTSAHNRMTLQDAHTIFTYSNQNNKTEVDKILSHQDFDQRLEGIRKIIAQLFGKEQFHAFAVSKSSP